MDDPYYWRTIKDKLTGQDVVLTDAHADFLKRVEKGRYPDPNYDPYAPFIDFFTYEKMVHPVTNRPEPKAAFIPSISEKHQISKMVAAIKRARLKPKPEKPKERQFDFKYDLWEKEGESSKRMQRYIPAPKMKLPGHEESYNPPPEYLLTPEEEEKWKEKEPEERKLDFIPQKYSSLRRVPAYDNFSKERFERCLDLYLCPRARKLRANVNPEDLIPKLPKPRDLQPFPSIQSLVYTGHKDVVRCISVEPMGQYFASGSDDKTLRIWEILTGRCCRIVTFKRSVTFVSWCPDITNKSLCAVVVEKDLYLINPNVGDKILSNQTDILFRDNLNPETSALPSSNPDVVDWQIVDFDNGNNLQWNEGIRLVIKHRFEIGQVAWHSGGDYFAVVMPKGGNKSVVIHQLSKRRSQVNLEIVFL